MIIIHTQLCAVVRYCAQLFVIVRSCSLLCAVVRYCAQLFVIVRSCSLLCGCFSIYVSVYTR